MLQGAPCLHFINPSIRGLAICPVAAFVSARQAKNRGKKGFPDRRPTTIDRRRSTDDDRPTTTTTDRRPTTTKRETPTPWEFFRSRGCYPPLRRTPKRRQRRRRPKGKPRHRGSFLKCPVPRGTSGNPQLLPNWEVFRSVLFLGTLCEFHKYCQVGQNVSLPQSGLLLDRVVVMLKSSRPYNLTYRGCAKFYRKLT